MISKFTKVIFINEATESTLDINDWKILMQGGYSVHNNKYQAAKSFINRCPMIITSQQKLIFGPTDQPTMDRGGDFNCILNARFDKYGGNMEFRNSAGSTLQGICTKYIYCMSGRIDIKTSNVILGQDGTAEMEASYVHR